MKNDITVRQIGWIVMPEDIDNPNGNINHYELLLRTDRCLTKTPNGEINEPTEPKRKSFWEKLRWLFTNK